MITSMIAVASNFIEISTGLDSLQNALYRQSKKSSCARRRRPSPADASSGLGAVRGLQDHLRNSDSLSLKGACAPDWLAECGAFLHAFLFWRMLIFLYDLIFPLFESFLEGKSSQNMLGTSSVLSSKFHLLS